MEVEIRQLEEEKNERYSQVYLVGLLWWCPSHILQFPSLILAADVKSDYDRNYNLAKLHSFKFGDQFQRSPKDALAGNELVAKRLHAAIQQNLAGLGMQQEDARPDFVITYYVAVSKQAQVMTSGLPRLGGGRVWIDQYAEGTAIVEFRDTKSGELIWRGFVTETVDPDKSEQKINNGIKKLIARFAKDRENQQRERR